MTSNSVERRTQLAWSEIIVQGGEKGKITSGYKKLITKSAVVCYVAIATGQPVKYSTAFKIYLFPMLVRKNGPAKSMHNLSK